VFGRRVFVNKVFEKTRKYFGEKRRSGARTIREVAWKEARKERLYSMRALKKEVMD
jgi:hypothetical protein